MLRVDLYTGEHNRTLVVYDEGGQAARRPGYADADTVWRSDAELFEKLVTGESQPVAALLRNDATLSGDVTLFLAFGGSSRRRRTRVTLGPWMRWNRRRRREGIDQHPGRQTRSCCPTGAVTSSRRWTNRPGSSPSTRDSCPPGC
ncbi:hypothetical protein [Micromonospora sp. WMMB482]|uniref:hypothetical protein n=1 Tax=Micromonospora sp. WMMB482 TaxID=2849653 RepID=UPI0027DFB1D3|nr:hypothetical protein [Micromonospora sp. WMMB482]